MYMREKCQQNIRNETAITTTTKKNHFIIRRNGTIGVVGIEIQFHDHRVCAINIKTDKRPEITESHSGNLWIIVPLKSRLNEFLSHRCCSESTKNYSIYYFR